MRRNEDRRAAVTARNKAVAGRARLLSEKPKDGLAPWELDPKLLPKRPPGAERR
ncbi:MAG TPA: hypothetical protein VE987_15690 [Polyangiaceae bacterium]|nr:hypothetical protein [Polyangiaceae bacterium]